MKYTLNVAGLSGAACVAQVEKSVYALDGLFDVSINVVTGEMRVSFDPAKLGADDIIAAVSQAGYIARAAEKGAKKRAFAGLKLPLSLAITLVILYLSLSGALSLPMFTYLSYPLSAGILQLILLVPVMLLNKDVFTGGASALKNKSPNLYTLIALGAAASAAYSLFELVLGAYRVSAGQPHGMHLYFDTSAMILALIGLGKYLEARARRRALNAITRLSNMRPEHARVARDGEQKLIFAKDVQKGETLIVREGDIVPADGTVLSGEGRVDARVFTGEAAPTAVRAGSRVTGASACLSGEFYLRADKPLPEMRLTQILTLVEQASLTKAPISRLADRVAGIFVPLVLALSLITGVLWAVFGGDMAFAVKSCVCVLVVSCPCALGLATPAAIMAGAGVGAEIGILIKNAAALEKLKGIDTVMFDKAGTLTAGETRVTGCVLGEGTSMRALIALAASAEQSSEHPLAQSILQAARQLDVPLDPAEECETVAGQGVRAKVGDMRVLVGNLTMMQQSAQDVSAWVSRADQLADEGASAVYVAADGRVRGLIALKDALRPSAREAVKQLNQLNIHTLMLTGDDTRTAAAIATEAGVSEVRAGLSTEDKDVMLRILSSDGKRVMLVSDGAQDSLILGHAELCVTVGGGTDIAIESAEVVILRGDMRLIPSAIQLGRMTMRVIRENLFWAFFYNVIGIPIAAGALYPLIGLQFSPMLGAAAMCLSSICVVVNALRLRRFRPGGKAPEKRLKRRTRSDETQNTQ